MNQHQSDIEVERLVQRSAAFRTIRAVFLRLDAAVSTSTLVRRLSRRIPLESVGLLLTVASLTHALLVSSVPPQLAPAGRYLFAVVGLAVGLPLFVVSRWRKG